MALQTSGPISFNDIKSEFGGSGDIKLSDYYRGGPYVPSSITVSNIERQPASGWRNYAPGSDQYITTSAQMTISFGGNSIVYGHSPAYYTSYTIGGWTYFKGPVVKVTMFGQTVCKVRRQRGSSSTQAVNGNIPTSGTIRLDNFYGGTRT